MKKILVLTSLILISACAQGPIYRSNTRSDYTHYNCTQRACQRRPIQQPKRVVACSQAVHKQPRPAPVVHTPPKPQPCNTCNKCSGKIKVTKEPVEIIYKKVTTKTVYEPRTITSVSYEKEAVEPQHAQQLKTITTTETKVEEERLPQETHVESAPQNTTTTTTISYTIDSDTTPAPIEEMSAEEIK